MAEKKKRASEGASVERHREVARQYAANKSRSGRDIAAEFPAVIDAERKARAAESFEFFCRTYFPQTFNLPWSNDHREAIALIEEVTRNGGRFSYAMPRGSGKTSLAEAATVWVTFYGYRLFPVVIGSDETSALEILESIKSEIENNDLLLEDFPEVCHPIRRLEGIAQRANGQLFDGERTHVEWTAKGIVLPTIPDSKASGAVIAVTGITGRLRGMKFKRPDGKSVRPDLALLDDPQTDESARSPSQCQQRGKIISGSVMGLAGPGKDIAALMPCTVIEPGDLADEYLDRDKHPEWQGKRTKLIYQWPDCTRPEIRKDGERDYWEEYRRVRSDSLRAGNGGKEATGFYKANREAMDKGAVVAWLSRHKPSELSALQHAMNLRFDLGGAAFFAEYQNDPLRPADTERTTLTAEQIAAKVNGYPRGVVPAEATRLTAFIDVQQDLLFWGVCAFEDDFTGFIIDYGAFPDQRRSYFTLRDARLTLKRHLEAKSLEESLRRGLDRLGELLLTREWLKDDGSKVKVDRCLIDANWPQSRDVVYKFCRESVHSAVLRPSHGVGVGAKSQQFSEYKAKRGERKGDHWRETLTVDRPYQRRFLIDTNHYKSFAHERLSVPLHAKGGLTLFGKSAEDHRLLADHLTAEQPVKVEAKGRAVIEWTLPPAKPDNHFLDVVVGCHAAAAERGAALKETAAAHPTKAKRIKLSELQQQKSQ